MLQQVSSSLAHCLFHLFSWGGGVWDVEGQMGTCPPSGALWTKNCHLTHNELVAQTVKNLPAVQETAVWSLGREDPLEEEMSNHSSILAWGNPDRGAWQATDHGVSKSQTRLSTFHFHFGWPAPSFPKNSTQVDQRSPHPPYCWKDTEFYCF